MYEKKSRDKTAVSDSDAVPAVYIRRTMPNVTVESTFEIGPKMENAQLAAVQSGGGPEILYTQDYYTYA